MGAAAELSVRHRVSFGVDAPYLAQFQRLYRAGDLRPVADYHPGDAVRVEVLGGDAGVYIERPDGSLRFRWVRTPTSTELAGLTQTLARRIGRYLERPGLLERDAENSCLAGDVLESGPMEQFLGSSITYRIALGPQQGRKVFTIQTRPACDEPFDAGVGKVGGVSLHAGVAARADQRQKLERLCRYISRPAISEKRPSLTPNDNVRYQWKRPYRDGTTHAILLRASCPPPFGPAFGCSKSLQAILSSHWTSLPGWQLWSRNRGAT